MASSSTPCVAGSRRRPELAPQRVVPRSSPRLWQRRQGTPGGQICPGSCGQCWTPPCGMGC
eukprot:11156555-Lingulodinium_polyedra.AAC.1